MAHAELIDLGLKIGGILATCTAIGSGVGITVAVIEEKSLREIEFCGFVGTAIGCLLGMFALIAGVILIEPL